MTELEEFAIELARLGSRMLENENKVRIAKAVELLFTMDDEITRLRCALDEGNRSGAEGGSTAKLSEVQFNRLAQFVYEGISDSAELELLTNMTAKAELVEILKTAMRRLDD